MNPMERFEKEDVLSVLASFHISSASRASDTDSTEEIILLSSKDWARLNDVELLTRALMEVLPHKKVWVTELSPVWKSEPLT
jgi:hypothetical protein